MKITLLTLLFGIFLPFTYGLEQTKYNEQLRKLNNKEENINSNQPVKLMPARTNLRKQNEARNLETKDAIVINLEPINKMSFVEFLGRRLKSLWSGAGSKTVTPQSTFMGRCIGMVRKLKMMMPMMMIGMGVIGTTLAFLTVFSLKSLALLGLLVMMNVAAGAAKVGALFAAKKHDGKPQVMHFHVHPDVIDHHGPHSSGGYWEDRNDFVDTSKLERKDLYNLYDKLKAEEYRKHQQYLYS